MRVSLDEELSTKASNVGDVFTVTLLGPVTDAAGLATRALPVEGLAMAMTRFVKNPLEFS